jgi:hypothetical protein
MALDVVLTYIKERNVIIVDATLPLNVSEHADYQYLPFLTDKNHRVGQHVKKVIILTDWSDRSFS